MRRFRFVRVGAPGWLAAAVLIAACTDSDQVSSTSPDAGGPNLDAAPSSTDGTSPADGGGNPADASPADGSPADGSLADAGQDAGITVTGKALDVYYRPWAGTVTIGGKTVALAADGSFTIPGVTAPYDAIVVSPDKKLAYAVLGITRSDPLLAASLREVVPSFPVVSGALPAALVAGEAVRVHLEATGDQDTGLAFSTSFAPSATYSIYPSIPGADPQQGTLWAFKYTSNDNKYVATDFLGWTKATKTVPPTGTTTIDLGPYTAIGNTTVATTISLPVGYTLWNEYAMVRPNGSIARQVVNQYTGGSLTTTMAVPDLSGATFFSGVGSMGPADEFVRVRKKVAGGGNVALDVPAAATAIAPADNATAIGAGAAFSWTAGNGVYEVALSPMLTDGGPPLGAELRVLTSSSSITLPDFAAAGVTFAAGAPYTWFVSRFEGHASIDAVTGAKSIDWICDEASAFLGDEATCSTSGERQFTMP